MEGLTVGGGLGKVRSGNRDALGGGGGGGGGLKTRSLG